MNLKKSPCGVASCTAVILVILAGCQLTGRFDILAGTQELIETGEGGLTKKANRAYEYWWNGNLDLEGQLYVLERLEFERDTSGYSFILLSMAINNEWDRRASIDSSGFFETYVVPNEFYRYNSLGSRAFASETVEGQRLESIAWRLIRDFNSEQPVPSIRFTSAISFVGTVEFFEESNRLLNIDTDLPIMRRFMGDFPEQNSSSGDQMPIREDTDPID